MLLLSMQGQYISRACGLDLYRLLSWRVTQIFLFVELHVGSYVIWYFKCGDVLLPWGVKGRVFPTPPMPTDELRHIAIQLAEVTYYSSS
jgi:hypothetical protein